MFCSKFYMIWEIELQITHFNLMRRCFYNSLKRIISWSFLQWSLLLFKSALEAAVESKVRGNKYFKGREYHKAIECYKKALELASANEANTAAEGSVDSQNGGKAQEMANTERATFHQNLAAAYQKLVNKLRSFSEIFRNINSSRELSL